MENEPTTPAASQEPGVPVTQPVEQPAEAASTPAEPISTPSPTEPAAPATENLEEEFDAEAFWANKGIDLSTPEGRLAAAKSQREAEQKMHQATQKASDIEKNLNEQPLAEATTDPALQDALTRTARVETTLQVERWKSSMGITPEQDEALGQYLVDNPQKAWMVKNGHLTLDDVYALSGVGKADTAALKAEGKREALQTLATKQLTTAPSGNAATSAPAPQSDPILDVLLSD